MATTTVGGTPVHDNHTAPASLTARTKTYFFVTLLVYNDGGTEAQVSFDGTNSFPVPSESTLSLSFPARKTYYTSGSVDLKVILGQD